MFVHDGRLPHVLSPEAYFAKEHFDAEQTRVFGAAWHLVGVRSEWERVGSQRALELGGAPVLVRRGEQGLRAFVNVCVHRHAVLVAPGDSAADAIRCPYHGFTYGDDGALRHVPDARCFRGGDGALGSLAPLALETHGELVFVALGAPEPLDAPTESAATEAFTPEHRVVGRYQMDLACNWKVALENVLENFHVAELHQNVLSRHPEIFRLFTGTSAGVPTHALDRASTRYHDTMGGDSRWFGRLAEAARPGAHPRYLHLHAFPNTVIASTHLASFAQTFVPTSPTTSTMRAWLALHEGPDAAPWARALRPASRVAARSFMARVLAEDAAIYPRVQRGLTSSPHRGVLSAREERVHAFQRWLTDALGVTADAELR